MNNPIENPATARNRKHLTSAVKGKEDILNKFAFERK